MDKKPTVWTISGFYVVVNKISVAAATMPPVLSTNKVLVYFLCNCFDMVNNSYKAHLSPPI